MATNIEIEAKVLINQDEYKRIVRKLQKNILKDKTQVNYYIDTKDYLLKKSGIGLRVRALNNEYIMTLKVPMSEGLLEKNTTLKDDEFINLTFNGKIPENDTTEFVRMLGFEPNDMSVVAKLKTHRLETNYGEEGYEFSIDENEYNNITDYELEMAGNSLLKAKTQLQRICNENGIEYQDNPRSKQTRAMESLLKVENTTN